MSTGRTNEMFRPVSVLMMAASFAVCVAIAVYFVEQGHPSWYTWGLAVFIFVLTIYVIVVATINDKQG